MIETLKDLYKRLSVDFWRVASLVSIVSLLLWLNTWFPLWINESVLAAFFTSSALVICISAISHLTRRILFPSIDLKEFAKKSLESPIGSAISFFGVCLVLSVIIAASVMLMA